ncbi:MAG: response regulator transcription factor [Polyangiaceae bacterium]|nr:response regulator transcription factor [Polyangiaceae bacterium]
MLLRPGGGPLRPTLWPGAPPTIWVVDDDDLQRLTFQRTLRRLECHTECFGSARDVLGRDLEGVDLILVDLRLAGESGVHACRALRARGFDRGLILVSGADAATVRAAAREAGADDFVTKPVEPDVLYSRVLMLVRRLRYHSGTYPVFAGASPVPAPAVARPWAEVEAVLASARPRLKAALIPTHRRMLAVFESQAGGAVTRELLEARVFAEALSRDAAYHHVGRFRRALRPYGIGIGVERGTGWFLEVQKPR